MELVGGQYEEKQNVSVIRMRARRALCDFRGQFFLTMPFGERALTAFYMHIDSSHLPPTNTECFFLTRVSKKYLKKSN